MIHEGGGSPGQWVLSQWLWHHQAMWGHGKDTVHKLIGLSCIICIFIQPRLAIEYSNCSIIHFSWAQLLNKQRIKTFNCSKATPGLIHNRILWVGIGCWLFRYHVCKTIIRLLKSISICWEASAIVDKDIPHDHKEEIRMHHIFINR